MFTKRNHIKPYPVAQFIAVICLLVMINIYCSHIQPYYPPAPPVRQVPGICADSSGSTAGFIRILYPNGGEIYHIGDTMVIGLCTSDAFLFDDHFIQLSLDCGKTYHPLITFRSGDDLYDLWKIPPIWRSADEHGVTQVAAVSDSCLLQVSDYETRSIISESAAVFRILP
jgi:hypothetical protein